MADEDNLTYLTPEGLEKIKSEISSLKNKLHEVSEHIEKAKELGDLSENAEYHEAKDDFAFTQGRIQELEAITMRAQIVPKSSRDMVSIGSSVKIKSDKGRESEYSIVGSNEADPLRGKISNESPLALAFLGKKRGDRVEVKTPTGSTGYQILEIS
ncbi:MAG: Transcription elongation factor GreA [Candidatus Magasanikbacteria bacterium GW2011_GWC2_40_17]|uniref:Transcription elongation factor GreA n=1 Tax=Candidatus Magasanikbacteria bacterium GW2011_GWA2_42_32 TaxID=1619039 RepID=A0A0G1D631_9BACT|nr:MAG: Transcription elongation factor GreA [Candidatus Magasanikbacteria bacterium GW2011_GWC2_40_17]KKS57523.1 MAG: Transcription elongation factor GreA [Candidatus Magasanikbacteria bacterium GW2011_GWA2_42_32]OGH85238.1 MAG: transcription elongation factor GreA [Candidatus Magasanikbacteria bacterium RIFOXYB2_FULL_38_10]